MVFGGLDKRIRYNDVWLYSIEDREWMQIDSEGPLPEPRAHFTATKFGSRILVFGGYGGNGQVSCGLLHALLRPPHRATSLHSCSPGSADLGLLIVHQPT